MIVGAYDSPPAGRAYVVFGRRHPGTVSVATMTRWEGFVLEGQGPDDRFGRSVSYLGCFFDRRIGAIAIGADSANPLDRESAGQVELTGYRFSNPECGDRGDDDHWRRDDRRGRR